MPQTGDACPSLDLLDHVVILVSIKEKARFMCHKGFACKVV